jgi:uncharacterized protein (TIGR03382 family)
MQTASAFAPSDSHTIGVEPIRVYEQNASVQLQMRDQRVWSDFTADFGSQWTPRFDELTGIPRRITGPGLRMTHLRSGPDLAAEVERILAPHARLIGLTGNLLNLRSANYVKRVDTWYLEWDSVVNGLPVYRGGMSARIKHGNLISLGFNTYGLEAQSPQPEHNRASAIAIALDRGPAPTAQHENIDASLMWLPEQQAGKVELRLSWRITSETAQPVGQWVSFVDAASGELINTHNEVRFLTGNIKSKHHERHPGSSLVTSDAPDQWVYSETNEAYTDLSGVFDLDSSDDEQKTAELRGKYLRIYNEDGSNGRLRFSGSTAEWTTESATQGEIDSYTFLHQVREWGASFAPEVGMVSNSLRSYVNKTDGNCNAYFNGDVNFYAKDGSCNNTAEIADVNYHEWGHGFHYSSVSSGGGVVDGSVGEGASDVISMLLTRDPVMARYFFTNGNGIRSANNDKRYPEDLVGEVHADGTIFSAAMWDLINIFKTEMSEEEAYKLVSELHTGLLKGGPTIDSTWDEIIVADDDDGNLSNGTPHYCQMLEAFGNHGLGPGAISGSVNLEHAPLANVDSESDHPIAAELQMLARDCVEFNPEAATVQYRVNGGSWQENTLNVGDMTINGDIPQQSMGDFVEYYITVSGSDDAINSPYGAFINPYSFFVGDVIELFCTDFEESDAGFTHELISGENTEGADDWQRGTPAGEGGDPSYAYSGSYVWGNDLGEDNYNGEYQNDKHNRLNSPEYDLYHYQGVFLEYYRWLHVEDGYYDSARILANGEDIWDNYDSENQDGGFHHKDLAWAPHAVALDVPWGEPTVQLAWEIQSDEGLSLGGWNIDDVCLYAPATANNRLAITDFLASDDVEGGVNLTWTHPAHAPVQKVTVIRKEGDFPQGPTDGAVAATISELEPGQAASIVDTDVNNNTDYYYAVYGSDGSEWLGWTIEGWNADIGATFGLDNNDEILFESGGCSCTASSIPWTATSGLLGLFAFAFSRRRRSDLM